MKKRKLSKYEKLAEERTILSNERTMLSSIRTAFAVFLFGIGIIGVFRSSKFALTIGITAIIFGLIVGILGIVIYLRREKKIEKI